ncbi:nitroreductase/quinone reductase family protein [Fodinicola feengrottensis]|uniref:Nitroreductase family deazaflavin-dependent oxidoreductase n=1 Tax=Fodinicola feengrottensis TaxID=435914 RepID=A0ABN2GJV7_9ACTN|nr:nitroreductase/quinone reductase family protein [Fodinicola feengrottensis]
MTRSSSELANADLKDKLLSSEPQPLVEGGYALRVVSTHGRRTGRVRSTPLGVLQVGERWYLVSPDAGRDWVRNLRTDPICTLTAGRRIWRRRGVGVNGDEAVRVIVAYLGAVTAPWALAAFPVSAGQPPDQIRQKLPAMAVFRLDQPTDV